MTKRFFFQILLPNILLVVFLGAILFLPFTFYIQKDSFIFVFVTFLRIIVAILFATSLINLIVLGFIKTTQALKLSRAFFLILAFFLFIALLYIPIWFKPDIPEFDPLKHYTIYYAHPLNAPHINYIEISYLNQEEIRLEVQEKSSLKRYQCELNYNEFEEIIIALNELKNKSRYSLVICPIKFLSAGVSPPYLNLNARSFYFHSEKRFLFQRGFVIRRWCHNFPNLEKDPHSAMLDLVNRKFPSTR